MICAPHPLPLLFFLHVTPPLPSTLTLHTLSLIFLPSLFPSFSSPPPSFPLSLCVGGDRAVPLLGAALQKPFREYLEAQKAKMHHRAGEGIPTVSTGASASIHSCARAKKRMWSPYFCLFHSLSIHFLFPFLLLL